MSGIFGIVNLDGRPVDQTDLEHMSEVMAHRGPDGGHIWADGSVGLGHLMLHSTPESLHEVLPWRDPASGLRITADARIDNRGELLAALGVDQRSAKEMPDSQLILAAFRKWGETCVDHLLGDFSFVIWDAANQQLFCARDHMGLKPFYYYLSTNLFVFASAAAVVAGASRVPRQINEGRIADFLVAELEGINKTCTFFEKVYRMPPAHLGVLKRQNLSLREYWKPDPEIELQLGSDDEYADALEEVLTAATQARLRSHKPVSAMLSGGVDSSTIAGIARKLYRQSDSGPLRTYSGISDDESGCRESSFIRMVIEHGELDPFLIRPSDVNGYAAELGQIAEIIEDPFDAGWTFLTLIYLSARAEGNVVVLDGIDGDGVAGLTTAYPSYLMREGKLIEAFREIKGQRKHFYRNSVNGWKAHVQAIRPVVTPNILRHLKKKYWVGYWNNLVFKEAMLAKQFSTRTKLAERRREYLGQSTLGFCPSLRHAHAERIVVPYLTAAIERYGRLAAYCGVEARQPFLDRRVIELCLSLPWQQKVQNGWSKYCLRKVLERVAPHQVAWRPGWEQISWKFGFAWDQINKESNMAILSMNRPKLDDMLVMKKFDDMSNQYMKGEFGAIEPIMNIVNLLRWLAAGDIDGAA